MFCFWHCFLSFVLFLILTVCGLFHSEETSCFILWDIFICAEVLVLAFWSDFYSNLFLDIFCFWHCLLSFVSNIYCLWTILFWRSILFHILRYFHFCWSIGISFLVWSFYFIVKYVLFLTLLSFICFVSHFNCLWTILFWVSILFQIVK